MSGEDTGDEPPKIDTALWSRYSGMLLLCKGKRKYLVGRSPVPVLLRAFLAGQGPGRPLACLLRANRTPCSWGPPSAKVRFSPGGGCGRRLSVLQPTDSAVSSRRLVKSSSAQAEGARRRASKPGRLSDTEVTSRRRKSASAGTRGCDG